MKNGKRAGITILIIVSILLMQGCTSIFKGHAFAEDGLSKALVDALDSKVLKYEGRKKSRENYSDVFIYSFMIKNTKEGIGEELLTLYDITNETLKSEEYQDQQIEICVFSEHFQLGVRNCVVTFKNYDADGKVYDHIYSIWVNGIDDMTEDYDSLYRYDLNNSEYWSLFSDTENIGLSWYVECQSKVDSTQAERESIQEYLLSEYGDYIEFGTISVSSDACNDPSVGWPVTINAENLESGDEYASVTELVESIRKSLNDYYDLHSDSVFLNLRLSFGFTLSTGESFGGFTNYEGLYEEPLDGFYSVYYRSATTEELCQCEDIKIIDLYGRSVEEIELIIESVEGIEEAYIYDKDKRDELSSKYSQITFR